MKYFIWNILEWIDMKINHGIVDRIFDRIFGLFPMINRDGSDTVLYKIWEATSTRYCHWVVLDLWEHWFPDDLQ